MKNSLIQVFEYFFLLWHKNRNWLHSLVSFVHALWLPTNFFCIYSPTIGSSNRKNIQLDVTHKMVISARQCFCSFAHFTESNKWKSLRNKTKLIFFRWFLCWTEKKPIKANSHGCSKIQKEIYKYFRVTMECFFFHFGLLQKPWSAKRNSEWFFSWSLAWNGNGFVRKLQLKKKSYGLCVAYYKFSTSTMSIKNMYSTHTRSIFFECILYGECHHFQLPTSKRVE